MMASTLASRPRRLLLLLLLALLLSAGAALLAGSIAIPPLALLDALSGTATLDPLHRTVLVELRLPRLLAAWIVGGGLAIAGCTFQAVLRNPLADPSFIGVSGGAAVAAAAALSLAPLLGLGGLPPPLLVPLAALLGALGAALLVLRIAEVDGETPAITLLLAGLAINAIAGGLLGLIAYTANDTTLRVITLWLFGSLGRAGWSELTIAAPLLLVAGLLLWRQRRELNALLLGEAEAAHIGIDVEALKRRSTLLAVLSTALAVAIAGVIGFVGLMVPHLLRMLLGPDHRALLPLSFLGGALLLSLADTVARIAASPAELPVGIVTALLGAPFFIVLLLRWRRDGEGF